MRLVETIYLNRDNTFDLLLLEDGSPVDLSNITRATIGIGEDTFDSNTIPTKIFWSEQEEYPPGSGTNAYVLKFKLGTESLAAGTYRNCSIVTYDATNPNGVLWTCSLTIKVKDCS